MTEISDASAMTADITAVVNTILAKAPDWLRRDLLSDNINARRQAEETLAAMISAALVQAWSKEAPITSARTEKARG